MKKITVNIKKLDIFKMQLYLFPRLRINYFWFSFFMFFVGLGSYNLIQFKGFLFWFVFIILFGAITYFFLSMFCNAIYCIFVSEKSGAIGSQVIEFNDDEFIETSEGSQTKTKWNRIKKIYKSKNFIYIQITGWRIHIIPQRDFDDNVSFGEFWDIINNRIKNA